MNTHKQNFPLFFTFLNFSVYIFNIKFPQRGEEAQGRGDLSLKVGELQFEIEGVREPEPKGGGKLILIPDLGDRSHCLHRIKTACTSEIHRSFILLQNVINVYLRMH